MVVAILRGGAQTAEGTQNAEEVSSKVIACSRTFLAVSEPPSYYEASSFPPYPPTCDDALLTTGPEDRGTAPHLPAKVLFLL